MHEYAKAELKGLIFHKTLWNCTLEIMRACLQICGSFCIIQLDYLSSCLVCLSALEVDDEGSATIWGSEFITHSQEASYSLFLWIRNIMAVIQSQYYPILHLSCSFFFQLLILKNKKEARTKNSTERTLLRALMVSAQYIKCNNDIRRERCGKPLGCEICKVQQWGHREPQLGLFYKCAHM